MTFSMTGQHKGDLFRGVASIFCSASNQTWKRGGVWWGFIVDRTYVFNRRSTLKDRSAEALVTGIVNMIHKMVSIEGYSTGFTASSVSQSEVGI